PEAWNCLRNFQKYSTYSFKIGACSYHASWMIASIDLVSYALFNSGPQRDVTNCPLAIHNLPSTFTGNVSFSELILTQATTAKYGKSGLRYPTCFSLASPIKRVGTSRSIIVGYKLLTSKLYIFCLIGLV